MFVPALRLGREKSTKARAILKPLRQPFCATRPSCDAAADDDDDNVSQSVSHAEGLGVRAHEHVLTFPSY